jgi:hypothetical protein
MAMLPKTAKRDLEAIMTSGTYEYKSNFARRYYSEGEAKGEAKAIMAILSARGIAVPEDAGRRIGECTDLDLLEVWVRRAVTAESVDDLFI